MKTIYITGSNGFVGKAFCASRQSKHFNIVKLHHSSSFPTKNLSSSSENVLLHLGWAGVLGSFRDDDVLQSKNLDFAKLLCNFCLENNINQILALGSQAEYGINNEMITESSPLSPLTSYARTKVEVSQLLSSFALQNQISFTWLRLFDTYGPFDNPNWFLPYIINSYRKNMPPKLSSCHQIWDYLYIDDLVDVLYRLIDLTDCKYPRNSFYNLCSGEHVSLKSISQIVRLAFSSSIHPIYGSFTPTSNQQSSIRGCNYKLCEYTGWHPSIDLVTGIIKTIGDLG